MCCRKLCGSSETHQNNPRSCWLAGCIFGFESHSFEEHVTAQHEILEYYDIQEMHITSTITGDATLAIKSRGDPSKFILPLTYYTVKNTSNTVHLIEFRDSNGHLLPLFRYADTLLVLHLREKN